MGDAACSIAMRELNRLGGKLVMGNTKAYQFEILICMRTNQTCVHGEAEKNSALVTYFGTNS